MARPSSGIVKVDTASDTALAPYHAPMPALRAAQLELSNQNPKTTPRNSPTVKALFGLFDLDKAYKSQTRFGSAIAD